MRSEVSFKLQNDIKRQVFLLVLPFKDFDPGLVMEFIILLTYTDRERAVGFGLKYVMGNGNESKYFI